MYLQYVRTIHGFHTSACGLELVTFCIYCMCFRLIIAATRQCTCCRRRHVVFVFHASEWAWRLSLVLANSAFAIILLPLLPPSLIALHTIISPNPSVSTWWVNVWNNLVPEKLNPLYILMSVMELASCCCHVWAPCGVPVVGWTPLCYRSGQCWKYGYYTRNVYEKRSFENYPVWIYNHTNPLDLLKNILDLDVCHILGPSIRERGETPTTLPLDESCSDL